MRLAWLARLGVAPIALAVACHEEPPPVAPVEMPAVASTVAPAPAPLAPWSAPTVCAPTKPERRSLDALVAAAAPPPPAGHGAHEPPPVTLEPVVVGIPAVSRRPGTQVDVASGPGPCLYADALTDLRPELGAPLLAYLAAAQAARAHPVPDGARDVTAMRRRLVASLEQDATSTPRSSASSLAVAALLEEGLRRLDETGHDAGLALVGPWTRVMERTPVDSPRGAWARLMLAGALRDGGQRVRAQAELDALAGRSLAWATVPGLFALAELAEDTGDRARALAAYGAAAAATDDVDLAGAARWKALLAAHALGRADAVLGLAITSMTSPGAVGERDELRDYAVGALVLLGPGALGRLAPLPAADAVAIAHLVSVEAEQDGDLGVAAAAADRSGETARAAALRKRRPSPFDERDAVDTLARQCFQASGETRGLDFDVDVRVRPGGVIEATAPAAPGLAECIAVEAPHVFARARRSVRARVLIRT